MIDAAREQPPPKKKKEDGIGHMTFAILLYVAGLLPAVLLIRTCNGYRVLGRIRQQGLSSG